MITRPEGEDRLELLRAVARGELSPEDAVARLEASGVLPVGDAARPFARLDLDRERRCGFPEVIYGPGKTPEQVASIGRSLVERGVHLLATRLEEEQAAALLAAVPDAEWHPRARLARRLVDPATPRGEVAVVSAGTADQPVADEARLTAEALGTRVHGYHDCGVAGLERLLGVLPAIRRADAIVVVAGMEGALASVVGGLVDAPVIAVPTSVGYGVSLQGLAPLLTMLSSCATGVAVVNIDNGFGAGYLAARIAVRAHAGDTLPSADTAPDSGAAPSARRSPTA